jgi:hypothetical protein
MPISRNVPSSSFVKAATAFLISRWRRQCAHRLVMARQGLASQLWLVSRSGAVAPGLAAGETREMNSRRSHREISSGCGALASVGHDSTEEVAIAFSKAP